MLEVSNLTRQYGSFTAVDKVSFCISKGEIVGLLGHNGAGKTTIMKMLSGFLEPNQGLIKINGTDLTLDPKSAQQGIGYLPESLPLYPEMIVADYLDYAAELKGIETADKDQQIKKAVEATAIGDRLLSPIGTLSRGYKQRVGVAQAILGEPGLLILDEPTNGLDPTQTDQMRQLIRDLARQATVILSTHIMQEVDALCGRVLILRSGHLAVDAQLDTLRHSNHLLVSTSLAPEQAEQQWLSLAGMEHVETLHTDKHATVREDGYLYRCSIKDRQLLNSVSAALAASILQAGAELYRLQPEQRDLETLFREVSQTPSASQHEDISDAA